jgi:hypothetical protein
MTEGESRVAAELLRLGCLEPVTPREPPREDMLLVDQPHL